MKFPEILGVMILPGAALFPGALLPLYIFEPRYRQMLAGALEEGRMFAVAQTQFPDGTGKTEEIGGAGLVRACVGKPDGTSHLILQGVARVRFGEWLEGEDFPQARVETLTSRISDPDAAEALREVICRLCLQLGGGDETARKGLEGCIDRASDLAAFSDMVAATVVSDAGLRQHLIGELSVNRRLELLAAYLGRMVGEE